VGKLKGEEYVGFITQRVRLKLCNVSLSYAFDNTLQSESLLMCKTSRYNIQSHDFIIITKYRFHEFKMDDINFVHKSQIYISVHCIYFCMVTV